jgi:hypothetical protein
LLPAPASAHQSGISYGDYRVRGDRVEVTLRLTAVELAAALPSPAAADPAAQVLAALSLQESGSPCRAEAASSRSDPPDGLVVEGSFRCPRPVERLRVEVGLVNALPRGHTHLAKVEEGGRIAEHVVRAGREAFEVEGQADRLARALRFLRLGVEHILTGYDHVAFLLALLLLGGTLGSLIRIATGFTLAHSVTLALAALGLVSPPAWLVEPLIAGTVVYVAAENLWALRIGAQLGGARRAGTAFAFGLIHGFGFAAALQGLDLPRAGFAASLLAFNLGVEVGQVALLAFGFPILAALRRRPGFALRGAWAGSAAIGCAGLVWLAEGVFFPGQ